MKDLIGFYGYPHPNIIEKAKQEYKGAEFIDLDVDYGAPFCNFAPENFCSIIKNILNNAFFYKDRIIKILAATGRDKCDSGLFAAKILSESGFIVEESIFEGSEFKKQTPFISKSNLPLIEKVNLITKNIIEDKDYSYLPQTEPNCGFWGVPPDDLSILELFPENTHVYGWLRCVDMKTPYDIELEKFVDTGVKTVFFAQTFCAKNLLAKYLANKNNMLYIDMDKTSSSSTKAKIEAFLRLR